MKRSGIQLQHMCSSPRLHGYTPVVGCSKVLNVARRPWISTDETPSLCRREFVFPRLQWHQGRTYATSTSNKQELRKTALHDLHVQHGGKMVPFGGYSMPVQYSDLSVRDSHLWTREKASLFDVGHMVQHRLSGYDVQSLLTRITPSAVASIPTHQSTLSCLLWPGTGGIVDDCIITRLGPDSFYIVTNAACRDKDIKFIEKSIDEMHEALGHGTGSPTTEDASNNGLKWEVMEDQGLVAIQGPLAATILKPLLVDRDQHKIEDLHFGHCRFAQMQLPDGSTTAPLLISRGGYTGEDGFEISIPREDTTAVVQHLMRSAGEEKLRFAGLGARDSLRLEAGMCLYGHDLDDKTTPVEGGLSWVVAKDRRNEGGFNGAEVILQQLKPRKDGGGVERRRVGFVVEGPPAREGAQIMDDDGRQIGHITSGCPSPSLGKNVAMGYIESGHHQAGKVWQVSVRGKKHKATVTKMPFLPSKYWKGGVSPG